MTTVCPKSIWQIKHNFQMLNEEGNMANDYEKQCQHLPEEKNQFLLLPFIRPYIASYSHRDGRMKSTGTWSASPLLLPFMQVFKAAVSLIPNKTSAKSSTKPTRDAKNTYKQQLAFVCSHHLTFKFSVPKRIFISIHWRQCDKLVTHFTYNHFY